MANVDLHGAEVLSQQTSPPIVVAGDDVVGLVGAAPNSESGVAAKLAIGVGDAAVVATAVDAGVAGNNIEVVIVHPGSASQALTITLAETVITVSLATDATSAVTTTASQLIAAWATEADVVALATLALATGSSGADTVAPLGRTALAGGLNDFAPLNTPVAVLTAADAARLGTVGSLPAIVADAWRSGGQDSPPLIVVRVADETAANLIGSRAAGTGVYALLAAESGVGGLKPAILATGSKDATVAAALEAVADDLDATPVVSLDAADYTAAVAAKMNLSTALCIWPDFVVTDRAGTPVNRPGAAMVAGHIARIDHEVRPGASPSNWQIRGVLRTTIPIDAGVSRRNSTANLLNRANIVTAIRRRGQLRLWGNRVANGEVLARRRTRAIVRQLMLEAVTDYNDRDVDAPFIDFILEVIQLALDRQVTRGLLLPGSTVSFPTDANTPATLAADQITFDYNLRLASLSEHFIFRETVTVGLRLSEVA